MKVLITGAGGFIGKKLWPYLVSNDHSVRIAGKGNPPNKAVEFYNEVRLGVDSDWAEALSGVDAVVHLAARVHVMRESSSDPLALFREINVLGTARLAEQAASLGVKHFIFLSSIAVNGKKTLEGQVFSFDDDPAPKDDYGISKLEAENKIIEKCQEYDMNYTIIRPPMVYGANAKGNFPVLMHAVQKGIPLPFGSVRDNRRSYVGLGNLVSLISECLTNPDAANQIFLVSDGIDLSTAELIKKIGEGLGKPARLIRFPVFVMKLAANLLGKSAYADRLLGDLRIDLSHTTGKLGWKPPYLVDDEMRELRSVSD